MFPVRCRSSGRALCLALAMRQRGFHIGLEQRVAVARCRGEFRVELHADEPRVHRARQLHHFRQVFRRRARRDDHPGLFQLRHVVVVHFVAMTMALVDLRTIDLRCLRAGLDRHALRAQAHGAAQVGVGRAFFNAAVAILPFGDQRHHRMLGLKVEFRAVGVLHAGHVAGELDDGQLHPQADAQVRHGLLAGVLDRADLAFRAALAEAARHQDRVERFQHLRMARLQLFGIDVLDVDARRGVQPGMAQRLDQRLVRLGEVDILADHADGDLVLRVLQRVHHARPHGQVGRRCIDAQLLADDAVEALLVEHLRNLVDGVDVPHRDHRVLRHVGEQRDLRALVIGDGAVGAAQQRGRLDADLAQLLHRVLGRLGLELAGAGDERHQRQMHERRLVAAQAQAHLPRGFQERQRLDVAHRAADLDDRHVCLAIVRRLGATLDEGLDLVGDVRNDLHRLAEILAATLLADHGFVDLAGGEVVGLAHLGRDEALVVAKIEVGFCTVLRHEHLAVLERAHRARVDVDVGIEFEEGDFEAARLKDGRERGGGDALAERGHNATGDEYELGHKPGLPGKAGL